MIPICCAELTRKLASSPKLATKLDHSSPNLFDLRAAESARYFRPAALANKAQLSVYATEMERRMEMQ